MIYWHFISIMGIQCHEIHLSPLYVCKAPNETQDSSEIGSQPGDCGQMVTWLFLPGSVRCVTFNIHTFQDCLKNNCVSKTPVVFTYLAVMFCL